jgi:DNA repair protein RadC
VSNRSGLTQSVLAGTTDRLSDEALLAVVLGHPDDTIAREVLRDHPAPEGFWRVGAAELVTYPNVGPSAAARVVACLELGRRAASWPSSRRPTVATPADVVSLLGARVRGLDREHFWALALGTKNHLNRVIDVSVGSLNASIVHPRELFREAVRASAASVVVVHNHPSGDPTPSGADIQLTRRLVRAGDVLGIELLDHVVIGDGGEWASLRELGML